MNNIIYDGDSLELLARLVSNLVRRSGLSYVLGPLHSTDCLRLFHR